MNSIRTYSPTPVMFDPPTPLKGGYKPHVILSGFEPPFRACSERSEEGAGGQYHRVTKYFFSLAISLLICILPVSSQYTGDHCIIKSEFIYNQTDVPFPSCHASTIVQNGKQLVAAWFGGTAERNPDVGIWVSIYNKGIWGRPVEVANGIQHKNKRYPCWNPVLFNNGTEMFLFYKVGPSPSKWWGELMTSDDGAKTWSQPRRLPEDITGPVKNKPVLLDNGLLLCPSSTEDEGWRVHMELTGDAGITWERTGALNSRDTGAIQPAILKHPGGRLQIVCRSTIGRILTSWSDDGGRSWSALKPLALPNPNSGLDAVTLSDGRHLLVYNHLGEGRNMLNVALSQNGIDWEASVLLEKGDPGTEFSYPAVIRTNDGMVHITYTWNRKQIKHVVIDPSRIVTRPFSEGRWPD